MARERSEKKDESTASGSSADPKDAVRALEIALAEKAESERRFRQLAESIREIFWMTDVEGAELLYVSPAYEAIFGRTCESLRDAPSTWRDAIHAEDRAGVLAALGKQREGTYDEQYRIERPDGTIRWIRDRAFPVRDERGKLVAIAGLADDVTRQRELETELRQAQRMESIAQLAGGVAHDFNNLLTVISSNCDFVLETADPGSETATFVREIRSAGLRAATLTQQLLAFSRRQFVELKVVDLNHAIGEVKRMVGRLVGKEIRVVAELDPTVTRVRVDPSHLTQMLINLAMHARDGMTHGGQLTLSTRNVELAEDAPPSALALTPGLYGVVSVTDTGEAVSPEMRARLFEPFFAARGAGRGTGLGLSAVHGMVVQNGGAVEVRTESHGGTTFSIHLPAADEVVLAPPPVPSVVRGMGTVLLVEDDAPVRRAARRMLESEGYVVLVARDGRHALDVYRDLGTAIDLLLTDVVMPEMGGTELARALAERQPGLRVLYTSGYTDDAVIRHVVESSSAFLQKPYTRESLVAKVRETIAP